MMGTGTCYAHSARMAFCANGILREWHSARTGILGIHGLR